MAAERNAKGPRNRPRARLVCDTCRSKKIKCDAEKIPSGTQCSPCRASQSICNVNPDADRRRHGNANHRFHEMQERIRSLEAMIKPQSSSDSVMSNELRQISEDYRPPSQQIPTSENSGSSPTSQDTVEVVRAMHNTSSSRDLSTSEWRIPTMNTSTYVNGAGMGHDAHAPVVDLPTGPPSANFSPLRSSSVVEVVHDPSPSNTVLEAASVDGADRVYCHPGTGEVAFYGSTTQSHLHSPNDDDLLETNNGQGTPLNMDSTQLRRTLLDIFFKIQSRSKTFVHEEIFRREKAHTAPGKRSRYYSDFLECSMLALAARHSTSSAVRALVRRYGERAKGQITLELDQPNIATIQGFLILSDFEATRGRSRTGWTYCNIATSLLVDLALHVETSEFARRGSATALEVQLRIDLLLVTFVFDTLWSLYLARPGSISSLVLAAVRRVAENYPNNNTLYMWVRLCLRMLDIIEILNAAPTFRQLDTNPHLHSQMINLRSAFDGVSPELKFDDTRIEDLDASAYTPYLQYFGIQVTLYRAIITAEQSRMSDTEGDIHMGDLENMQVAIHDNAIRIAKLISSYQSHFGTENMVTVMLYNIYVAAIALMSHILQSQQASRSTDSDVRWLKFLHDAMTSVETHFPIARRMRSSLEQVIQKTPLVTFFPNMVPVTPQPSILPATFTDSSGIQHDQVAPNDHSEFSDPNLIFSDDDATWTHYLAWNMPFMSSIQNPNQGVGPMH